MELAQILFIKLNMINLWVLVVLIKKEILMVNYDYLSSLMYVIYILEIGGYQYEH